jgi:hypothetical protein
VSLSLIVLILQWKKKTTDFSFLISAGGALSILIGLRVAQSVVTSAIPIGRTK